MYMILVFEIIYPPCYGEALMRCLRRMSGVILISSVRAWLGQALTYMKMPRFVLCCKYCQLSSYSRCAS